MDLDLAGNKMKALEYGRQLSKRTKEVTSLMWSVVVKDREKRYPDFFNPAVWKQLELRLARVLSRSENYLSQMFVIDVFFFAFRTL